jgi:hypothetical protein
MARTCCRCPGNRWAFYVPGGVPKTLLVSLLLSGGLAVAQPAGRSADGRVPPAAGDYELTLRGKTFHYMVLPRGQLWEAPLANQREPRMYGKLTTLDDESTIDTAVGAEFGLGRLTSETMPQESFQLGAMAAAFTRFNQKRMLVATDFRAGIPLTYAKGPWQAKLAYEHTSAHLGDDYMESTGRKAITYSRDEVVVGLARRFRDQFRLYGQMGYAFAASSSIHSNRDRYDWGIEWSKQQRTGLRGQPFVAFDMDLRSYQDYEANITVQFGWQWKEMQSPRSTRLAVEFYNGKSPFGQFFLDSESWVGVCAFLDW